VQTIFGVKVVQGLTHQTQSFTPVMDKPVPPTAQDRLYDALADRHAKIGTVLKPAISAR